MRAWIALLLSLAGTACGRVDFDARPDASTCPAVGHDEDGDGIDDACDSCPHLAADPLDSDGDGVGDACDPEPAIASSTLRDFDPMTAPRAGTLLLGEAITYDDDDLVLDGRPGYAEARFPAAIANNTFEFRADLTPNGEANMQLGLLAVDEATNGFFYCELIQGSADLFWRITYTLDGTSYMFIDQQTLVTDFAPAEVTMRMRLDLPFVECTTSYPGTRPLAGAAPAGIAPTYAQIGVDNIEARVRSFVNIEGGN